jgi:outer membrane receptor protein involved in Fe transport
MCRSFFYRMSRLILLLAGGFFIISHGAHRAFPQTDAKPVLRGVVFDPNDNIVPEAVVKIIFVSGWESICANDKQGGFSCEVLLNENFTLEIRAEGFSILRQTFTAGQEFTEKRRFTLSPAALSEEVVVTANRTATRLSETAAAVTTLARGEIAVSAAPTVDDQLRQVAGFTLFRRTGSRYANPTAQGVSLRGVGASGASRSLVLFDGVPLNDVFGGWVQWNRVAPVAVERIEVMRGGASHLYGSDSLSGAVNILPRRVTDELIVSGEIYGGTQKTFSGSMFSGFTKNGWSADLSAAHFQTRGYIPIDESERGPIDSFTGSRNANFSGRIARKLFERTDVFFKASYFDESRTNGTPAQINRTHLREFVLGGSSRIRSSAFKFREPAFEWRIFGGTQGYDQTFSAVSADRRSESLTRAQYVPAQNLGFSGQISGVLFEDQTLVFGFEGREVRGASDEVGFSGGRAASVSGAGGRERSFGLFFQDLARPGSRLVVSGSLRYDRWKNYRAFDFVRTLSNGQTAGGVFPDRSETAFSPQASALYQISEKFSVFALVSKSFRAPTLNELYRSFRVGNVVTAANENLKAERALNFEAGASFSAKDLFLRGNFFYTRIDDAVANVTLASAPDLITRQRQNAGQTRAGGIELEAEKRFREFVFSAGYLLTDSRVTRFPSNAELENLFVPQTARHQFTFQTRYARAGWTLAFQGRASSAQFDDDLNTLRLEPFFQMDAFAARRLKENWQIFGAVENVFNSRYSTGKTPVRSVSAPPAFRLGVRFN